MDRDKLMRTLPSEKRFRASLNHEQKAVVENLIEAVLDQLADEHRDPDRWEEQHITKAIGYLLSDCYLPAAAAAVKALAPTGERPDPQTWMRTDDTATTGALRGGFEYAAGKPVRNG